MTQVLEEKKSPLQNLTKAAKRDIPPRPWLAELHKAGVERFNAVGFPNARDEEWRGTNLSTLAKIDFVPASPAAGDAAAEALAKYTFGDDAAAELVFVNGFYAPQLSRTSGLPRGVGIAGLASSVDGDADRIRQHLGRHADIKHNPFVALNTGVFRDGAFVNLGRGSVVERPIHLLFISVPGTQPAVSHPRVLVVAQENAQASIVETYAGTPQSSSQPYFTNVVMEMVCGADSVIDHCKLQQENRDAYHIATMQIELARNAHFVSHSASIGSKLTRNDLNVMLNGEYADATLNGLVLISGDQHVDNHTLLRHEKANCPSHELYKHVLDDRATGIFKGKIFVQKDAQKTDSKQTSKSLLLSDDAYMNSQPALEIYADDVKCTHGSTIGPVDEEMIFYLRSRGISLEAARHLLTYAFAADITRRIRVEPVRRRIEEFMAAQHGLPQDLRITDLGSHDEKAR
jgi:Fe-S cluster assembly protein SufD